MKTDILQLILRFPTYTLALVICFYGVESAFSFEEPGGSSPAVELLVKLRADAPIESGSPHSSIGATVIRSFDAIGWQLVRLPEGMSAAEGLARYKAHPAVAAVERNSVIRLTPPPPVPAEPIQTEPAEPELKLRSATANLVTPNDPRWSRQWNLRKIGMPAAWAVTTGSSNVVVAVLDTGVDYTHEDLLDNMWRNPGEKGTDAEGNDKASNQIDDDQNGYVDDVFGIDTLDEDSDPMDEGVEFSAGDPLNYHGTGCAGIIAATLNNYTGISGVAGSARIMAIRVFGRDNGRGSSIKGVVTDILEAFNYLLQQKRNGVNVRVASNSWGWIVKSIAMQDALRILAGEGVLLVFAAGNDTVSNDLNWWLPTGYDIPEIISVAATDSSDALANFSNWGRSTVDLGAPGVQVPTLKTNLTYINEFTGTSAACPHAAGAAALLLAVKPDATPLQLKAALMQSVDQVPGLRERVASNGRLNVARALEVLTNSALPAVVVAAAPGSSHSDEAAEIVLHFSVPMNRASVEGALDFDPPVAGTVQWNDESTVLTMRPSSALLKTNHSARLLGTAMDANGRTIDGDFDRTSEGSPADDFVCSFSFAPPNDDFAGATVLTGPTGSLRAGSTNTTMELDEPLGADQNPLGAATLWYQWQADEDGWMTFDTSLGSTLDTIVAAYTGTELAALEQVGYSEGFGLFTGGRASFRVRAGTNYVICVAGQTYWGPVAGYIGPFTLSWYPTPAPNLRSTQFFPRTGMPGATVTVSGTNFTGATEVLFNGARAAFTLALTNNEDLRITVAVPPDATDGPITIRTPHGEVTSSVNFVVMPPPLQISMNTSRRLEVSWPATSFMFVLEATSDFSANAWKPVVPLILTNGSTLFNPEPGPGTRFFRLTKRLPIDQNDPRGVASNWETLLTQLRLEGFVVLSVVYENSLPSFSGTPEEIEQVRETILNRLISQGFVISEDSPCRRCAIPFSDIHSIRAYDLFSAFYMTIMNAQVLWSLAKMPEVIAIGGTVQGE